MSKIPSNYGLKESAGDYPEDFPHENGMYLNKCYTCDKTFIGHKRRNPCKVCYTEYTAALDIPTELQKLIN